MKEQVVVTGLGCVSPFGCTLDSFWDGLYEGKSTVRNLEGEFDISNLYAQIACYIPNDENIFPWAKWRAELPKAAKFVLYGLQAAQDAMIDAGLISHDNLHVDPSAKIGVVVGSGIGGLEEQSVATQAMMNKGAHRVSPFFVPTALINLVAGHIAIRHKIKGPNQSQVAACSTGAIAIADGARMIREGRCDMVLVGAAESSVCRLGIAGFAAIKALAHSNEMNASCPFDQARSGFVMGEGAGILVLESKESAIKRGAKIYCEYLDAGLTNDAYHLTAPCEDGDGAARAMQEALDRSGLKATDIDYLNAHATSTPLGDKAELKGIKRVFADNWDNISISSVKGSIGHMLGAAGSIEVIAAIMCLNKQIVLPTINLHAPDEAAELNGKMVDLVPNKAKSKRIRAILKNSFGFGGHNAALIFKEYSK